MRKITCKLTNLEYNSDLVKHNRNYYFADGSVLVVDNVVGCYTDNESNKTFVHTDDGNVFVVSNRNVNYWSSK